MYVKVRVIVGAKEEKIIRKSDDHFNISVKEKAKANEANRRIKEILVSEFETGDVRLVSGHHSPSKIFSVEK